MPNEIEKAQEIISILRNKPFMILDHQSFSSLKFYLLGYLQALGDSLNIQMNIDISKWLQVRLGRGFSVLWTDYVLHICDNDEARAKAFLLDLVDEYLKSREKSIDTAD